MTREEMREAIRRGLKKRPRQLPSELLYDALGSALFEAITLLPEYEVTRADFALLTKQFGGVLSHFAGPVELVELGPGAGAKAAVALEHAVQRQHPVSYVAVDVSPAALRQCRQRVEEISGVTARVFEASYLEGLDLAARVEGLARVVLFLGSNLSNFGRDEAAQFLRQVRARLQPGDGFLLATDLDKSPELLVPAYDDALGVTAAFNRNALQHLNREWGARFPLDAFRHRAIWNAAERRMEMHLEATRFVSTRVLEVDVSLSVGETLWTESSHRFQTDELRRWGEQAGLRCVAQWVNSPWAFAHTLFKLE